MNTIQQAVALMKRWCTQHRVPMDRDIPDRGFLVTHALRLADHEVGRCDGPPGERNRELLSAGYETLAAAFGTSEHRIPRDIKVAYRTAVDRATRPPKPPAPIYYTKG